MLGKRRGPVVRFRSYKFAAVIVGGIMTAIGLAFFWIASIQESLTRQTLLNSVGTLAGTVGLLSIVYDAFLKPQLLVDMGAAADLGESGIARVQAADDLHLSDLGYLERDLIVVIQDLRSWLDRSDWNYLLTESSKHVHQVRIYCSAMSGPEQRQALEIVRSEWRETRPGALSPHDRGSKMVIFSIPGVTQVTFFRSGVNAVVGFGKPFTRHTPGTAVAFLVQMKKSLLWDWVLAAETGFSAQATEILRLAKDDKASWW